MDDYSNNEMIYTEAETEVVETAEKPVRRKSRKKTSFLKPSTLGGLILRIVLFLGVPYGYLMLCGLIFDKTLHMYNMTTFIFFSYVALQLAGIILAIISIINYVKAKKSYQIENK